MYSALPAADPLYIQLVNATELRIACDQRAIVLLCEGGRERVGVGYRETAFENRSVLDIVDRRRLYGSRKRARRLTPGLRKRLAVMLSQKVINFSDVDGAHSEADLAIVRCR